jgi:hypothetical protein
LPVVEGLHIFDWLNCQAWLSLITYQHIWCPYFANLREGKSLENDEDLVPYFRKVFRIREDLKNYEE